MKEAVNAIWDPDRCPEGVFCPKCDTWMDDYEGQPDKCPNSWPLFDTSTENGVKNRNLVLDILRRKEQEK